MFKNNTLYSLSLSLSHTHTHTHTHTHRPEVRIARGKIHGAFVTPSLLNAGPEGVARTIYPSIFSCSLKALVAQSCPTLCGPMDCSPPGSSAHGILQARILEWVATPPSRGSSRPRDQTRVSCTAGRVFTGEALSGSLAKYKQSIWSQVTPHVHLQMPHWGKLGS